MAAGARGHRAWRTPLAYLSGALLVVGGAMILAAQAASAAARLLLAGVLRAVGASRCICPSRSPPEAHRRVERPRGDHVHDDGRRRAVRQRRAGALRGTLTARRAHPRRRQRHRVRLRALQLHRLHRDHGARVDPAEPDVLGLGHRRRSPRRWHRAGERHPRATRRHAAKRR